MDVRTTPELTVPFSYKEQNSINKTLKLVQDISSTMKKVGKYMKFE